MFIIHSCDFEKIAISLSNISRNIDASDVAGIFEDEKSVGERLRDAVIDKMKEKVQESIHNSLNQDNHEIEYRQPKLKVQKRERFRFKKVAENVIPSMLRGPLSQIGIDSEERSFLAGKIEKAFKHSVKSELYGEQSYADQSSNDQRGGFEHGRSGSKGFPPSDQNRKAIQIIGKRGFGGQQVFLA